MLLWSEASGPEDACLGPGTADAENPSSRLPWGGWGRGHVLGLAGLLEALGVSRWAVGMWVFITFFTLYVGYANMKLFTILSKIKGGLLIFSLEMEAN